MKKFVLLLSIIAFAFTSCEGPKGPPGEDITFYKEEFTIRSQDWVSDGTGLYVDYYKCQVNVDIGNNAYEDGIVNVYLFQNDGGYEVQTPLPYTIQKTQGNNTWIEGFYFDFDAGTIVFYADWERGLTPPVCTFRVVVAP